MLRTSTLSLALLGLLAQATSAQTSSAQIVLGGEGSWSSEGTYNPGLLNDDLTVASARIVFHLDAATMRLQIDVNNTSPVVGLESNPVLTNLFFNVPDSITGLTLDPTLSTPDLAGWSLRTVEKAACFGTFDARLRNPRGIHDAIGNPEAMTYPHPSTVIGPVSFVLDVTGSLIGVTAEDFIMEYSTKSKQPSIVAAEFQGGGPSGDASAFINQGECLTVAFMNTLGTGCGPVLTGELPVLGTDVTVNLTGGAALSPVFFLAGPEYAGHLFQGCEIWLDPLSTHAFHITLTDGAGAAGTTITNPTYYQQPNHCGQVFQLQAVVFPLGGGVEYSNGLYYSLGV